MMRYTVVGLLFMTLVMYVFVGRTQHRETPAPQWWCISYRIGPQWNLLASDKEPDIDRVEGVWRIYAYHEGGQSRRVFSGEYDTWLTAQPCVGTRTHPVESAPLQELPQP